MTLLLELVIPMRRGGRPGLAAWVSAAAVLGVLAVAESGGFDNGALEQWRLREAVILAAVALGLLRLAGRTVLSSDVASAVAAGGGAMLGGFAVSRWGWDAVRADGLVPNLCDHPLRASLWIAFVALSSGVIALLSTLVTRNPTAGIAVGAFSAPLVVWWTHTAVAYGCG